MSSLLRLQQGGGLKLMFTQCLVLCTKAPANLQPFRTIQRLVLYGAPYAARRAYACEFNDHQTLC